MKTVILSGSSRESNNTVRLAYAMRKKLVSAGHGCEIVDFRHYDIPFPNKGSLNEDGSSEFQKHMLTSMEESQMVITLSPEYNWFPSAELVNTIHQLGTKKFQHLFEAKVFAFCGVSSGRGGRLPAIQLSGVFEKIISFFHQHSIISPKKFEGHYINRELDEEGHYLGDGSFERAIERFIDYNLQLAVKFL